MSTPITLSGFSNLNTSGIISAMMQAASVPLVNLQTQQSNLQSQVTNFSTLTTQLSALQSAAASLGTASQLTSTTATSSDPTSVTATSGAGAVPGTYDVVVQTLARAQVTASASSAPDANTTVVATGGSLSINGTAVNLTGSVTLQGLANAINGTSGVPVTASVVQTNTNAYRLLLTSNATGLANAFTLTDSLTGGTGVTFTDTNGDGTSGDSPADNLVQASNATALVNNLQITSSTNTLTTAIPGTTVSLLQQDPSTPIAINVGTDGTALETQLNNFVNAYNSVASFIATQTTAAGNGDPTSIARDPVTRQLQTALRNALTAAYPVGNSVNYLGQIGVEFTETGTMQVNDSVFQAAMAANPSDVTSLLAGNSSTGGAFSAVNALLTQYTQTGGTVALESQSLTTEITTLGQQISDMQARLATQQAQLQAEFTATTNLMTSFQNSAMVLGAYANNLGSSTSFGNSNNNLTTVTGSSSSSSTSSTSGSGG